MKREIVLNFDVSNWSVFNHIQGIKVFPVSITGALPQFTTIQHEAHFSTSISASVTLKQPTALIRRPCRRYRYFAAYEQNSGKPN